MKRFRSLMMGLGVLAVLSLFFLADPSFFGVDKRIYSQYSASLVEDFDLNVVNQIPPKETWLLTTTLNYPDVHSNGVAILWAPFFGAANLLSGGSPTAYRTVQTFASVFFGCMGCLFLWTLLRRRFDEKSSRLTMLLLLLGTPFYWYLVLQPENADITSFAMVAGLLLIYDGRKIFSQAKFAFAFGLALFACVAVKFDTIFGGLLMAHFLWERRKNDWKEKARVIAGFIFGALPLVILILLNEKIKAGFPDYPYLSTLTDKIYLLGEILSAPSGYLWSNPFYLVLITVFLVHAFRKQVPSEFWFFLAIPATELLLEAFNFVQNEGYGARHWVNDIPYFALLSGLVLSRRSRIEKRILVGGAIVSGALGFFAAFVYRYEFFDFYFTGDWMKAFRNHLLEDWLFFISPFWVSEKIKLWPILLSALALVFWSAKRIVGLTKTRTVATLFGAYSLFYVIATAGNVANNHRSPGKTDPNLLRAAVIGNGPHINSYFENVGGLERAFEYYRIRGDAERAQERKRMLEDYVRHSAEEIVRDPVGFREKLEQGQDRYIPESLRTDE